MKIGNKIIDKEHPVFIIAEAGVNHNGKIGIAKKLIEKAAESGADAVKFQTFKAEKLVSIKAKMCGYQKENTKEEIPQFNLLKKLELKLEDYKVLLNYANEKKIIFLSTPFDDESVDFLDELNIEAFKIASTDTNNIPFLNKIAKKNKPVILSTGMSDIAEIKEAVNQIKKYNDQIVVLHCTTDYPAKLDEVNLNAMKTIEKECNVIVGYSDHTEGTEISVAAVALGAKVIEKHFTLDRKMKGPDHKASIEPFELKNMISSIRNVEKSLGFFEKKVTISSKKYIDEIKKSIHAAKNIKKGEEVSQEMLIIKRPSYGIAPKFFNEIIGLKVKRDINKEDYIRWEDLVK